FPYTTLFRSHAARLQRHVATLLQLVEHRGVSLGPRNDDDVLVVLGSGPQDRRPTDVDLVEEHATTLSGRGMLGERVKIDRDEIDGLDALAPQVLTVRGIVAARQERGMDLRMECLYASPEKRRLAGHVFDRTRRDALGGVRVTLSLVGAGLPSEVLQSARERVESGAIRDREEGSQRG